MAQTSCPTVKASFSVGPDGSASAAGAACSSSSSLLLSSPLSSSLSLPPAEPALPEERRRFLASGVLGRLGFRELLAAFLNSSEACAMRETRLNSARRLQWSRSGQGKVQ